MFAAKPALVFLTLTSGWFCLLVIYAVVLWLIVTIKQSRIHFIEIHEQPYCPVIWREIITHSIQNLWITFGFHDIFGSPALNISKIIDLEMQTDEKKKKILLLDVCSGSGGPLPLIHSQLKTKYDITTIMTDLIPDLTKWKLLSSQTDKKNENNILKFHPKSVDATNVDLKQIINFENKKDLKIIKTMFASLHHFRAKMAKQIMSDAVNHKIAFLSAELMTFRDSFFFLIPFGIVAITPLCCMGMLKYYLIDHWSDWDVMKKLKYSMIMLLTVPIWCTIFVNDAVVSCARCHTCNELLQITSEISKENKEIYQWMCWYENANVLFPFNFIMKVMILYGRPDHRLKTV